MSYFCNKCKKWHSMKYNTHKRFAELTADSKIESPSIIEMRWDMDGKLIKKKPQQLKHAAFGYKGGHPIHLTKPGEPTLKKIDMGITLEKLAYEIDQIKKTLRKWGTYMDQHVKGWRKSGDWSIWAWNEIIGKDEDSVIKDEK